METYDSLILGAGWGGLTAASLLTKAGHRVAVLEARDRAGGCGHSFSIDGYSFCAEMQYLMGCGPGGPVHAWLGALDLLGEVQFNELDPDGYDRIEVPGYGFRLPHGAHRLQEALRREFPDETENIDRLFAVLFAIEAELEGCTLDAKKIMGEPLRFKDTLLYGPWSARRVFDHFGLSPRLRAILAGQCGDIGLAPAEEPFLCLQAVLFGYCQSAHFPRKGMGHFIERVTAFIERGGGKLYYDTPVTGIERDGDHIHRVQTLRGEFSARNFVSNIDPALTMAMIEGSSPPQYEASASCFTVFLGLDVDLAEAGFGRCNVWDYPDVDLDAALDRTMKGHDYDDPFFFLSTPSLYADPGVLAPPGCTTVQINVASSYEYFQTSMANGNHERDKRRVTEEILRAVERRRIPGLAAHCVVREAWSPLDLAQKTGLVRGGMYGAKLDFVNRVVRGVSPQTPFANLFLAGATAGGPGLQGVVSTTMRLVESMLAAEVPDEPPGARERG